MSSSPPTDSPNERRYVYGKDDALFGCIERQQQEAVEGASFGSVLDAGTGLHSLRWIATLPARGMTLFTAITADETMQRNCQREVNHLGVSELGEVLIGNWFDEKSPLVLETTYDLILADYLIGAMDGFSPYQQDLIIDRLSRYLKPHGRLYIVGLQPIPDSIPGDANIICKVRQVRDACILLAGHRCYREFPLAWIHRHIRSCQHLKLLQTSRFPILYRHATILKQINVARSKFPSFESPELVDAMKAVLNKLEQESLDATQRSSNGKLSLGFDYVVSAERVEIKNSHGKEC